MKSSTFRAKISISVVRINILRRTTQLYIGAYEPVLAECYGSILQNNRESQ